MAEATATFNDGTLSRVCPTSAGSLIAAVPPPLAVAMTLPFASRAALGCDDVDHRAAFFAFCGRINGLVG